MAEFHVRFFSEVLIRPVYFDVYIPNDVRRAPGAEAPEGPMNTVFWLHGYTGASENWLPRDILEKYNCAVISPSGENSFYLDGEATGTKYGTFVGKELPEYIQKTFGLAMDPEHTAVMGLSMGGFGALHTGLAYPETFGKIGAMSSALLIYQLKNMTEDMDNGVANYAYYRQYFGDLKKAETSRNNPEVLALEIKESGKKMPDMYVCCGTEDFLIEPNRKFRKFLEDNQIEHVYQESPGVHDMVFWNEYAPKILEWMWAK